MSIISKDISKAAQLLSAGELVAIPTETVYGLAGNIFNEDAIHKIFEVKQRPLFNPLIVHLHSINQINDVASEFPEKAKLLAEAFWPGPLTLILKKNENIPDVITAGKDTVAIRMPHHPVTIELLQQIDFPLAAPSANPFNRISPTNAQHVAAYFEGKIPMVLDGGSCKKGIESTIVGFDENNTIIYRLGSLSVEEIQKVIGPVILKDKAKSAPTAPGMLAKHYSPKTKTVLVENVSLAIKNYPEEQIGVLSLKDKFSGPTIKESCILSATGNLDEAASNLYNALHILDQQNLTLIIAERLPEQGLGISMNDRLERASS